jgi:hypothetical protein
MLSGFGVSLPVKRAYISAEYLLNQRFETFDHLEQTVGLRAGLRITRYFGLAAGAAVPLDDLIGGSSFDALPNGWSIGLEWYRPTRLDLSTGW